jgi:hypothetical protein
MLAALFEAIGNAIIGWIMPRKWVWITLAGLAVLTIVALVLGDI